MSKIAKNLETKRDALAMEIEEASVKYSSITDETEAAAAFDSLSAKAVQFEALQEQIAKAQGIDKVNGSSKSTSNAPAVENTDSASAKTIGDTFLASPGYKAFKEGVVGVNGTAFGSRKTVNTLGTAQSSAEQNNTRQPGFIPVQQMDISDLRVADLFRRGDVGLSTFTYVKEVMPVNTTAAVGEGQLKPNVSFVFEEEVAKRGKIAGIAVVTDELFMDHSYMRDYINNRMPDLIKATEDGELVRAPGTGVRILGMLNVEGIQTKTYSLAGDNAADKRGLMEAIRRAKTLVKVNGRADADAVLVNPFDMEEIELLKNGNGEYIGGGPFYVSYNGQLYTVQNRIWGLNVVQTEAVAVGEAIVGSFKIAGTILQSNGGNVIVESTNSNKDDFENNRQTIRAEEWLTPVYYRPSAICHIIGE